MHEHEANGLWVLVILNSAIFIFLAFSFTKPKTQRDWRSLGAFSAFIVALFTEMYGFRLVCICPAVWLPMQIGPVAGTGLSCAPHHVAMTWPMCAYARAVLKSTQTAQSHSRMTRALKVRRLTFQPVLERTHGHLHPCALWAQIFDASPSLRYFFGADRGQRRRRKSRGKRTSSGSSSRCPVA